jgi:hypothetical protein
MTVNASSIHSLRRIFQQGFTAQDIAEPLVSFDAEAPASRVKEFMDDRRFEIVGVRSEGLVVGFVMRAELGDGHCMSCIRKFDESQIVFDSTPLGELVPRLFVSILGSICGIVSRSDLQKPAVRMWLFGIVTLIEMRFTGLIEQVLPNEQWHSYLSDGRIRKAADLLHERAKRHQDLTLLDCLQLSDKAQIVARDARLRAMTQFESKRRLETATKKLENLRNTLAHSQDITTDDWDTVILLAEQLDSVLERSAGPREISAG